jgi:hypothetical protein
LFFSKIIFINFSFFKVSHFVIFFTHSVLLFLLFLHFLKFFYDFFFKICLFFFNIDVIEK